MLFMTPTVFRNVFSRPATRNHPFVVREPFAQARGELVNDIDSCIFCGMCERKCPSQCIEVDKDAGLWKYDPFACVYCGVCVEYCPVHCLSQKTMYRAATPEREHVELQGTPPKAKKKAAAKKDDAGQ